MGSFRRTAGAGDDLVEISLLLAMAALGTVMDVDITEIEEAVRRLPATDRVHLIEVIARSLRDPEPEPGPALSPNKAALDHLLDEMANLPSRSPADGFSNRDHDRVLYDDHQ